jgi:hypothetical protein
VQIFRAKKSKRRLKMAKEKERMEESIDEIESDTAVKAPDLEKSDDDWAGQEATADKFDDKDREQTVKLYKLFIGNTPLVGTELHPGFRKLCLDKKMEILPREIIRCVALERRRPRLAQVDYDKREKLKNSLDRYLGYSHDGIRPSMDPDGNFLPMCIGEGKPFAMCSGRTRFEDGAPCIEPLSDEKFEFVRGDMKQDGAGECPRGRWGNSLTDEDRLRFKIGEEDRPKCPEQVSIYFWDLDLSIPFVVYFKVKSLKTAESFIASFFDGFGESRKKRPLYSYEAQIMVEDHGNYATPKMINTKKPTSKKLVQPIIDWWDASRGAFIRPLVDVIKEIRERNEEAADFDPNKIEGK